MPGDELAPSHESLTEVTACPIPWAHDTTRQFELRDFDQAGQGLRRSVDGALARSPRGRDCGLARGCSRRS